MQETMNDFANRVSYIIVMFSHMEEDFFLSHFNYTIA